MMNTFISALIMNSAAIPATEKWNFSTIRKPAKTMKICRRAPARKVSR